MRQYYIYILASLSRRTYTGVTSDLQTRYWQHLSEDLGGSKFAKRYRINRLVHFETYNDPYVAISREKEIKGWRRSKKVELIQNQNPDWLDLAPGLGLARPSTGTADPSLRSG
jgi:putative endonuclease